MSINDKLKILTSPNKENMSALHPGGSGPARIWKEKKCAVSYESCSSANCLR